MKQFYLFSIILLSIAKSISSYAQPQPTPIALARNAVANQQMDSAIMYYKYAYEQAPFDIKIYQEYLGVLHEVKKYDQAIDLVDYMMQIRKSDPIITLDKVKLLQLKNKNKEAKKIVDSLLSNSPKSNYDIQKLANAFADKALYKEAITVYKNGQQALNNAYIYSDDIAKLYFIQKDWENGIVNYKNLFMIQPQYETKLQTDLLQYCEADTANKSEIIKSLQVLAKKDTENTIFYNRLINWLNKSDGNYQSAIDALISTKNPSNDYLKETLQTAYAAMQEKEYKAANKAFQYIISHTDDAILKQMSQKTELQSYYNELYDSKPINVSLANQSATAYINYFQQYPEEHNTILYLWYADIVGKYLNYPDSAITLITPMANDNRLRKELSAQAKLTLGDFYLFAGKVWDANLYYAQVDKMYRQDMFGEEARYKQAKLAFYRGDFEWAQDYLNILKASTTELIANDAMDLSILITENTATDSNVIPLKLYAQADLMVFQHQYNIAKSILDSIITTYPKHEILDDVYLLNGQLNAEEGNFANAIQNYQKIIDDFKEDVLADDALLKTAQIYELQLKDTEKAKAYYEQLILDFPNSTLVAIARMHYDKLLKHP